MNKLFLYAKILAVVGVTLSVYLLWQQLFRPSFQPCTINSWINCDAIISGEVAKTFGVPTPLFGLIGYVVMFYAAVKRNKSLLLGMATFGLFFCAWIAYKELVILRVICPVCILCQIVMISVFVVAVSLKRKASQDSQ